MASSPIGSEARDRNRDGLASPPARGAVIAVSITHGFQARNLLQTDVAPRLLEAGYRLLVLSPAGDDAEFRRSVEQPGIAFHRAVARPGRLAGFFGAARRYALASPRRNATYNLFNERYLRSKRPQYVFLRALNRVVGRWRGVRDRWMDLEAWLISGRELEPILRSAEPALLVTGTPGTEYLDALLLRRARALGVPSLCVVLSWDNLTSKGYMAARPDRLVVWNERMRQEAVELHDYAPDEVEVAGVAHFDVYQRPEQLPSRAEVCRRLKIDPERPYLVFGTVSPFLFPYNHEVAELLADAIAGGAIGHRAQLVIRLHPQSVGGGQYADIRARYERLRECYPDTVVLDVPEIVPAALQWALRADEMIWLASLLRHAGVCIAVGSTLAIDAALSDTPTVSIAFDGAHVLPYERSIRRAYDYTHYRPVVASGGAPMAESLDQLVAHVNRYLGDRSLDAEGRLRLAREQAWRLDGHSGTRVAQAIAAFASHRAAPRHA
jgi:hypothetical protein